MNIRIRDELFFVSAHLHVLCPAKVIILNAQF